MAQGGPGEICLEAIVGLTLVTVQGHVNQL